MFLVACLRNGPGKTDGDFLLHFLCTVGMQYFCLLAVFVLAVIVLNLGHSNILAVFLVVLAPFLMNGFALLNQKVPWMQYLNFQGNMSSAWYNTLLEGYWLKVSLACLVVIVAGTLFSYCIFQKQDL